VTVDNCFNADATLKASCQETLDAVKQIAGSEEFSRQYAVVQQALAVKRQERKTQRSIEVTRAFEWSRYIAVTSICVPLVRCCENLQLCGSL
jgi:hypothetical protein